MFRLCFLGERRKKKSSRFKLRKLSRNYDDEENRYRTNFDTMMKSEAIRRSNEKYDDRNVVDPELYSKLKVILDKSRIFNADNDVKDDFD